MSGQTENRTISDSLQQAIEWLVLLRSDDVEEESLHRFAEWLAQDHAHSEAFAEAEQLFADMSIAANMEIAGVDGTFSEAEPVHLRQRRTMASRRRWYRPALAVAACFFLAVMFVPPQALLWVPWYSDYHTESGEFRDIQLSDGSKLLLDTNSAVSIDYGAKTRTILLQAGRVRFEVAPDSTRPFIVKARDLSIKALGTVFQVRKRSRGVDVLVQEHAVELMAEGGAKPLQIKAGQQLGIEDEHGELTPAMADLSGQTAWQQQRLIVNDRPLADLLRELERYHDGHLVLLGPDLGSKRVTGDFSLESVDQVISKICLVFNLKVRRIGAWSWLYQSV